MDKKTIDIQKSLKKLFTKILILNFFMLAALLIISILYASYFKQRLAEQLSDSFRTPLINADNRQILLDMSRPVLKDFSGVRWITQTATNNFSIPENLSNPNFFVTGVSKVNIFFDDKKTFKYGELRFYYDRWSYSSLALALWIILFLFSVKLGYMEKKRLLKEYTLLIESEINKSLSDLSAQVAHDIRSPLAALDAALKGIEAPPEQKELVNAATTRIRGIAEDLLKKYKGGRLEDSRTGGLGEIGKTESCDIGKIIEAIILEKKAQYPDINFVFEKPGKPVVAEANPKELSRIISNLLNNAAEALDSHKSQVTSHTPKKVEITLKPGDGKAILSVKDNGKGIPPEILSKIGRKGFSHDKEGGNGLGLYHAKAAIEKWGGKLEIWSGAEAQSGKGTKGTEITIELPSLSPIPSPPASAVLIDDDALVRKNWEITAGKKKIEIKTFGSADDFFEATDKISKNTVIYIDSELENGVKGEEIAKKIYSLGFTEIYLETGHPKENFRNVAYLKDIIGKEPPF